ncbi:MAG: alpha/beta fold hydrolase, partial [Candidatus Methanomethylicaceae archaeon]
MQSIVDIEDKIPDPTSDIARGFYFQGTKKIGVLLIHGFTGTPAEMRQLGEFLYKKGYTVRCDPLPGHCTSPEDLKKTKWQDWVNAALKWIKEMKVEHEKIFVAGLSLGSLITAYLA